LTLLFGCSARVTTTGIEDRDAGSADDTRARTVALNGDIHDLCEGDFRKRTLARAHLLDAGARALPDLEMAAIASPKDSFARESAIRLIARIQADLDCVALLREIAHGGVRRFTAMHVLPRHGARAGSVLLSALQSEHRWTRQAAVIALRRITGRYPLLNGKSRAAARAEWADWLATHADAPVL
jgi:hypothetical protein